MNEISVKISQEKIRSCNGCSARNYDSCLSLPGEKVDILFEVIVGNQNTCLCRSCLNRLHNVVLSAIRKDDAK